MDVKKIVDVKFFGNFKKKSQKWPSQDLSDIKRNKVMKNQPIWDISWGLVYNNQPGGVFLTPLPCRIGLIKFNNSSLMTILMNFTKIWEMMKSDGQGWTNGSTDRYEGWSSDKYVLRKWSFLEYFFLWFNACYLKKVKRFTGTEFQMVLA